MIPPPRAHLITNTASGIGAALAGRVAALGVALTLHTRANLDGLAATGAAARPAGAATLTLTGDPAEPATAQAFVAGTIARFGRLGTPQEAAAALAFLLAPESIGINGALLAVDGGVTL